MARFMNKIAIVTGSSRGIGLAIVEALINEGATVIGLARTATDVDLEQYVPMNFDFGSVSVAQINELVAGIINKHKKIDVLVNNAGIIRRSPAHQFSEQDWDDVLKVNLKAPFFLTQAVARWWIERGSKENSGRLKIVNIASMLSFQGG